MRQACVGLRKRQYQHTWCIPPYPWPTSSANNVPGSLILSGSTQAHWPFPSKYVATGYAYILTHPGLPCIFWDHYFQWGKELRKDIDELVQVGERGKTPLGRQQGSHNYINWCRWVRGNKTEKRL